MRWSLLDSNLADCPVARYGHSAVSFDVQDVWGTELVVVFGGAGRLNDEREILLDDVCVFQVEQNAWVKPTIFTDDNPVPRAFHSSVPTMHEMIIFGGQSANTNRKTLDDTWSLDVDKWEWNRIDLESGVKPPARCLSAMACPDSEKIVLFGGRNDAMKALGDLWIFDKAQGSWNLITPTGPTPSPRIKHAMTQIGGKIWMYGGELSSGVFLDDLWSLMDLDGRGHWQWHLVKTKPKPNGRSGHSMIGYGSLLVCFGGHIASPVYLFFSQSYITTNELWILDLHSRRWIRADELDDGKVPEERVCTTLVATQTKKIFLFGGKGKDQVYRDSWILLSLSLQDLNPFHPSHLLLSYQQKQDLLKVPSLPRVFWDLFLAILTNRLAVDYPLKADIPVRPNPVDTLKVRPLCSLIRSERYSNLGENNVPEDDLHTLFKYFDVNQDSSGNWFRTSQPDDRYLDLALVSYAQSSNADFEQKQSKRSHQSAVQEARKILLDANLKEFKIGNLWLILADYKRLFVRRNIVEAWKLENSGEQAALDAKFLHMTIDNLRISDLPELMLDYKQLVGPH